MLHFIVIFILMIIAYIYLSSRFETDSMFNKINTERAKALVAKSDNVVLLDVRTPGEVDQGSIDGSIHINLASPQFKKRIKELDKSKVYVVYCRTGQRSAMACRKMFNQGFRKLYNLTDGYTSWQE